MNLAAAQQCLSRLLVTHLAFSGSATVDSLSTAMCGEHGSGRFAVFAARRGSRHAAAGLHSRGWFLHVSSHSTCYLEHLLHVS